MTDSAIFVALRDFALAKSRLPLMSALVAAGWRVIAATSPGGYGSVMEENGIEVAPIPFSRGGFSPGDARSIRELRRLYRLVSPTLVHHFNAKPVVYGALAARGIRGVRIVSTITGLGHGFDHRGVQRLTAGLAYRVAAPAVDALIFQNSHDLRLFVDRGWAEEERTRLIVSSGVDMDRFPEPLRSAAECEQVLMVSRLLWTKGVGEYVKAARILRGRGYNTPFVLGGEFETNHPDGVPYEFIKRVEEEGVVSFSGYIHDMPGALAEAGLFVAPSYYREGVARVLLEAGASRRPVVAADSAGAREVVRHNETGLLVAPRDGRALADAIEGLLKEPEQRGTMGEAASRRVGRLFSLKAVTEKQLRVYRDIGALDDLRLGSDTSGEGSS